MTKQAWDAADYRREGAFVAELATGVVALLDPQPGERVLDLGCGTGTLTARLAGAGCAMVGVDSAPSMVAAARAAGVDARLCDMCALPFSAEFDAVFSNAALHWVSEARQDSLLRGAWESLKPGGRFAAEMGGHGNIAAVRTALRAALHTVGREDLLALEGGENYFPSPESYGRRLGRAGFMVEEIALVPRPTVLGPGGMRGWYETFRSGVLGGLSAAEREAVLGEAEELLAPVLRDEAGVWIADYVRLRFRVVKRG